jgi:hypothetical protein
MEWRNELVTVGVMLTSGILAVFFYLKMVEVPGSIDTTALKLLYLCLMMLAIVFTMGLAGGLYARYSGYTKEDLENMET